jgi:hypothetical protein
MKALSNLIIATATNLKKLLGFFGRSNGIKSLKKKIMKIKFLSPRLMEKGSKQSERENFRPSEDKKSNPRLKVVRSGNINLNQNQIKCCFNCGNLVTQDIWNKSVEMFHGKFRRHLKSKQFC